MSGVVTGYRLYYRDDYVSDVVGVDDAGYSVDPGIVPRLFAPAPGADIQREDLLVVDDPDVRIAADRFSGTGKVHYLAWVRDEGDAYDLRNHVLYSQWCSRISGRIFDGEVVDPVSLFPV